MPCTRGETGASPSRSGKRSQTGDRFPRTRVGGERPRPPLRKPRSQASAGDRASVRKPEFSGRLKNRDRHEKSSPPPGEEKKRPAGIARTTLTVRSSFRRREYEFRGAPCLGDPPARTPLGLRPSKLSRAERRRGVFGRRQGSHAQAHRRLQAPLLPPASLSAAGLARVPRPPMDRERPPAPASPSGPRALH